MHQATMSLLIKEVLPSDAPMKLLLLADPSEEKIKAYLPDSRCFVACKNGEGEAIGACVVKPTGRYTYELMNIAVVPERQQSGVGTQLLKWVINFFAMAGAGKLEVGTGTFGYQLAFYQRQGFRVTGIDRDFFVKNYSKPVFENGIQLMDMLRLTLNF